jgi:hypothetical protein
MLSSKKYTLWGLKSFEAQKQNLLVMAELKKVYFMGSEMQPGVIRAQKREILISHVKKNLIFSVKIFNFSMELEVFFTIIQQTCHKFYE